MNEPDRGSSQTSDRENEQRKKFRKQCTNTHTSSIVRGIEERRCSNGIHQCIHVLYWKIQNHLTVMAIELYSTEAYRTYFIRYEHGKQLDEARKSKRQKICAFKKNVRINVDRRINFSFQFNY